MDRIRYSQTNIECPEVSIYFINDFDKGFTPVIEANLFGLEMSVTDETLEFDSEPDQNVELMPVVGRAIDLGSVSEPVVGDDAVAEGPENIECSGCFWCENFKGF